MKHPAVHRPGARRRGLTLLEVIFAVVLMGGVAASVGTALRRSLSLFDDSGARLELRSRANRCLERVTRELVGSSAGSLEPALPAASVPPLSAADLVFRRADRWTANSIILGERRRLVLQTSAGETTDGTDEDGDGLVDECELVLVIDDGGPAQRRITLASDLADLLEGEQPNGLDDNGNGLIDERGFCVSREGGALVIQLTAIRLAPSGALMSRTELSAVALRND